MNHEWHELKPRDVGTIYIRDSSLTTPTALDKLGKVVSSVLRDAMVGLRKKPVYIRFTDEPIFHAFLPGKLAGAKSEIFRSGQPRIEVIVSNSYIRAHAKHKKMSMLDAAVETVVHELEETSLCQSRELRKRPDRSPADYEEDEKIVHARTARRMKLFR